jgi:hypothetical protein
MVVSFLLPAGFERRAYPSLEQRLRADKTFRGESGLALLAPKNDQQKMETAAEKARI